MAMRFPFETNLFFAFLLAVASVLRVNAANLPRPEPCAQIRQIHVDNGISGSSYQIPAKLAVECLGSMPFVSELAVTFVQEYRKYLQFHSTIELLNRPPSGYAMPAVDLLGGLSQIEQKAATSQYQSQFNFDYELHGLIASACDGHLFIQLCSLSIFTFRKNASLVSISTDGLELPQVYVYQDGYLANDKSSAVSPVVSINGVDVVQYLEQYVSNQPLQDPDAQYNKAFPSKSRGVAEEGQGIWELLHWPAESSVMLKFENGSMLEVYSFVDTSHNLSDPMWDSGDTLFEAVCLPSSTSSNSASEFNAPSSSDKNTSNNMPHGPTDGYPAEAVIRDRWNRISGYFLNETGFEDVAVLVIPTFHTSSAGDLPTDETAVFVQIARDFIDIANTTGKSKILIDMSGNGGGNLVAGFNMFKIFFPGHDIYSATRFRSHDAVDLIGKIFARSKPDVSSEYSAVRSSGLDYHSVMDPDRNRRFVSWEELYGPHEVLGMNSSSLYARFNSSSLLVSEPPVEEAGTGKREDRNTRLFAAEDIVIITDGFCASTCALFIELMKTLGVRSITLGGRPQHDSMQLVGGVKGGEFWGFETIESIALVASRLSANASLTDKEMHLLQATLPQVLKSFPLTLLGGGVNFRNAYRKGDDQTPLQLVYEAADCRLFYTWENYVNQESVWIASAKAMFGKGACVQSWAKEAGSLDQPKSEVQLKGVAIQAALDSSQCYWNWGLWVSLFQ